jgi:hypothetical protein
VTDQDDQQQNPAPRRLRELFPEYAGPGEDQLREHLKRGLVVLDTNALFAAYRLNAAGRSEFLKTLRLFGDRLWVPHRVAQEFLENRLDVIQECAKATDDLNRTLKRYFDQAIKAVEDFGARRGLGRRHTNDLKRIVKVAQQKLKTETEAAFTFDLKPSDCKEEDPILIEVEEILADKIGPPIREMDGARAEADRRFTYRVPPGYMDETKPPDRAIGDFLIWAQVIEETRRRQIPVLFVTNDDKEDWVTEQKGPRPELVAEMRERTGQEFYLVNVRSFLALANEHMGAKVSDETITQAEGMREETDQISALSSILEDHLTEGLAHQLATHGAWMLADSLRGSVDSQEIARILRALTRANIKIYGDQDGKPWISVVEIDQLPKTKTTTNPNLRPTDSAN